MGTSEAPHDEQFAMCDQLNFFSASVLVDGGWFPIHPLLILQQTHYYLWIDFSWELSFWILWIVQVEYDFQYHKMEMPADVPVLVLSQVIDILLTHVTGVN